MRTKEPMSSRQAVVLWLGGVMLLIWLVFAAVITWCTAKAMDRYLEKENSQIAASIDNAARLHYFAAEPEIEADVKAFWIWDGANSDWLNNSFGGGLLRRTNHKPQTAVAIFNGDGQLLEKSGNSFFIRYITEENWYTQESDMACDGVARALYDPSGITKTALDVIRRTDWVAMRFTGTMENGYLTPSKIEYVSYGAYADIASEHYRSGSYERHRRIQEMEQRYDLTWETLMVSSYDAADQQVFYTLHGNVSLYDPGDPLEVKGVAYSDLMDYILRIGDTSFYNDYYMAKQGDLRDTLITDHRAVYTDSEDLAPAYRVIAAVRYSPMKIAVDSLLYVYIGSFLLTLAAAVILRRILIRNLVIPLEDFNDAAGTPWGPISSNQGRRFWREAGQMRDHYHQLRMEHSRLTASLQYAREAEASRRQMTSHIAHELKTPLAVIHSYAEGLKEHIAEEKRDKYLDVILSEVARTDNMVHEMLDLSRLEAGKVKLSRDEFSLTDLTAAIFGKLDMVMEAKELRVAFDFPKDITVTADESRIAQVIENFATNAIKYTPAGGSILVRIQPGRNVTTFIIENDCQPLSEEALGKVWDTFYRTDEARSGGGTGLGLAIARNIIELHGGSCSVRNTKTGVAFSFTI